MVHSTSLVHSRLGINGGVIVLIMSRLIEVTWLEDVL